MADNIHIIAERQRDDCAIQLIANSGYDRGVVLVRRRSGGVNITEAEVLTLLRRARVKLTEDVRQRLRAGLDVVNADPEPVSRFVVAQGVPAVPGKDAELTWVVEPNRRYEYQHDENDRVDYRRFTDTGTVKEEQLLLKVKPEEPGTPGLNIFGEVVRPRTGKSAGLRRGRNVRVSDDGREYYATVNGRVSFRHGVLSVENVYEAGGDVDFSTGNIDFAGPVIVRGDVVAGFEVKSGDWVEIHGAVESAHVAASGDITIHGGVNGRGKGVIRCGGDLTARYLNGVEIEAGGSVKIIKSVVHSTIRCDGTLKVFSERVVSSKIYAGRDVDVPVLGSERGVETTAAAGLDASHEREMEKLDADAEKIRQERVKLRHTLGGLVDDPTRLLEIRPVHKRLQLSLLMRRYFDIAHDLDALNERRDELESRSREVAACRIKVTRMVWQGVKLRIGDSRITIHKPRRGPIEFVPGKKALLTI